MISEQHLTELYEALSGRGSPLWQFLGNCGWHTYPTSEEGRELHDALCELERRGLAVRVIDEPDHCCFKAK